MRGFLEEVIYAKTPNSKIGFFSIDCEVPILIKRVKDIITVEILANPMCSSVFRHTQNRD